jgi:glycosyltransferase involved in cell wall biosynthesis
VPEVSVIVPARNASATLGATLDALAAQRFDGVYEVIVVDNASTDATAAQARRDGVRLLRNDADRGVAASRNRGAAEAAAPLLAFTDADCAPTPDWLQRGVDALRAGADLVQGAVAPPPGAAVGPWDRTVLVRDETGLYETASLFVRRDVLERAGGFPEFLADGPGLGPGLRPARGDAPFGEDALFGWRARAAGARSAFAADALVHHAVFPRDVGGYLRERWRLRFFPSLVREAPGMRAETIGGVFLNRRTAAFDAAVTGLALAAATRRAAPLLAVLPYARMALRDRPPVQAAGEVAADAVGCAALVCGSVAARRPLL